MQVNQTGSSSRVSGFQGVFDAARKLLAEMDRKADNVREMPTPSQFWLDLVMGARDVAEQKKSPNLNGENASYSEVGGELFGSDGPSANDVVQGGLADCYFLGSVASVVADDPDAIRNAIVDNGDGTYSVRFYDNGSEVWVTVDDELPVDANGNPAYARGVDSDGDGKLELWVPIMEKAYAKYKDEYGPRDGVSGYADLGRGGSASDALEALTGKSSRYVATPVGDAVLEGILSAANDGAEVVLATKNDADDGWVGWHSYTVLGTYERDGETMVRVYNPWGRTEPDEALADGANDGVFDIRLEDLQDQIKGVHTTAPQGQLQA